MDNPPNRKDAENARLKAELEASKTHSYHKGLFDGRAESQQHLTALESLADYARHQPACPHPGNPCDCGLNDLLAAWKAQKGEVGK